MRGWVLQDSEIDALELSDELKDFAREMAGESAVSLTDDRARILDTAALEVEFYVGRMMFRGAGGAPRVASSVVEVEAPFTVPAVGAFPRSTGVTVTSVERWDDEAEAFTASTYIPPAAWPDSRACWGHVSDRRERAPARKTPQRDR